MCNWHTSISQAKQCDKQSGTGSGATIKDLERPLPNHSTAVDKTTMQICVIFFVSESADGSFNTRVGTYYLCFKGRIDIRTPRQQFKTNVTKKLSYSREKGGKNL